MGIECKKAIWDPRAYGGDESCDASYLGFIDVAWHKEGARYEERRYR